MRIKSRDREEKGANKRHNLISFCHIEFVVAEHAVSAFIESPRNSNFNGTENGERVA